MVEFLAVLSLYYMCDATAAMRPMSASQVQACTAAYDDVKTYFVSDFELAPQGSLERFQQMNEADIAFQAWQEANPDLVANLRQNAWYAARGTLRTAG